MRALETGIQTLTSFYETHYVCHEEVEGAAPEEFKSHKGFKFNIDEEEEKEAVFEELCMY
jgi:hypothetical protein